MSKSTHDSKTTLELPSEAQVRGAVPFGLHAGLVTIKARVSSGSGFVVTGLPEVSARELKARVVPSLLEIGRELDEHAIHVSVDPPAEVMVNRALDLAVSIAVLIALGIVPRTFEGALFIGELSFSGAVRPVRSILTRLEAAERAGVPTAFVPAANWGEASVAAGVLKAGKPAVFLVSTLREMVAYTLGKLTLRASHPADIPAEIEASQPDALLPQHTAIQRALEIAAAGHHGVLFLGSLGSGMSLVARHLHALLPPLGASEMLQLTRIQSAAGLLDLEHGLVKKPPFRAPHHTTSELGLIGDGNPPRLGEVTLAHGGLLYLDEIAEFRGSALDTLSCMLDNRHVLHTCGPQTANIGSVWFPAEPLVAASAHLCPCGYFGSNLRVCQCTPEQHARYRTRLTRHLPRVVDIWLTVPAIELSMLKSAIEHPDWNGAQARIRGARSLQLGRARSCGVLASVNSALHDSEVTRFVRLKGDAWETLKSASSELFSTETEFVETLQSAGSVEFLSSRQPSKRTGNSDPTRPIFKVLRLARTIADLEQSATVESAHLREAITLAVPKWPAARVDSGGSTSSHSGFCSGDQ